MAFPLTTALKQQRFLVAVFFTSMVDSFERKNLVLMARGTVLLLSCVFSGVFAEGLLMA